ncbi:MAG: hypothetical protein O2826_08525 [Chloroflexi bacterium]|nr:hypothetical protein [Chloroflexota bacterium]
MQRQDDTEQFQIFHLALACYAYDAMTTYSRSLAELGRLAGSPPNLGNQYHRDAGFNWLNAWKTRMPRRKFDDAELGDWFQRHAATLPPVGRQLWELSNEEVRATDRAYDDLCRTNGWGRGTAASKVLFVLRPEALQPCDAGMRDSLKDDLDKSTTAGLGGYGKFLEFSRDKAKAIKIQCEEVGVDIGDLPSRLNQPKATVAALINEYLWFKYAGAARKFPSTEQVAEWVEWAT